MRFFKTTLKPVCIIVCILAGELIFCVATRFVIFRFIQIFAQRLVVYAFDHNTRCTRCLPCVTTAATAAAFGAIVSLLLVCLMLPIIQAIGSIFFLRNIHKTVTEIQKFQFPSAVAQADF